MGAFEKVWLDACQWNLHEEDTCCWIKDKAFLSFIHPGEFWRKVRDKSNRTCKYEKVVTVKRKERGGNGWAAMHNSTVTGNSSHIWDVQAPYNKENTQAREDVFITVARSASFDVFSWNSNSASAMVS